MLATHPLPTLHGTDIWTMDEVVFDFGHSGGEPVAALRVSGSVAARLTEAFLVQVRDTWELLATTGRAARPPMLDPTGKLAYRVGNWNGAQVVILARSTGPSVPLAIIDRATWEIAATHGWTTECPHCAARGA